MIPGKIGDTGPTFWASGLGELKMPFRKMKFVSKCTPRKEKATDIQPRRNVI